MRMRKVTFVLAAVLAMLLVAGCSRSPESQQALEEQQQNMELQQKVDELEKQEEEAKEEELQKQIDDLKAQQDKQSRQNQQPQVVVQNGPASAAPEGVVVVSPDIVADTDLEASALDAAISYYQAVEVGDYTYTYSALSSADQSNYAYDQWLYANNSLDSAAAEFEVFRALVDSPNTAIVEGYEHVADVGASIYYPDGSLSTRYTFFVYEGGVWKHWLTNEEMGIFNSAL
jgi:outer membrane murein-binding lipoprotein Lpp